MKVEEAQHFAPGTQHLAGLDSKFSPIATLAFALPFFCAL